MKSTKSKLITLFLLLGIFSSSTAQKHDHKVIYRAPKYEKEWMQPSLHPDRIVLNFGADPTTTASVTWRTSIDVDTAYAEIAKATPAPKFWRTSQRTLAVTTPLDGRPIKDAGINAHYHSVTFDNLEPNTLYGYRVGDGEHWSEWIQFRTASANNDKFSFLYVGDAQNYILELWSRLIREGFKQAPNARFIIHAGDLVGDAHSEEHWEEWFRAGSFIHGMIAGFPTPGNHEYDPLHEGESDDLEKLSIQWRPQFTLPENGPEGMDNLTETVYYMDFQDVRFISLNSMESHEEQAEWLRKVLADNPNTWTIMTFHHPLYSASQGRTNTEWRALLQPILDEYHVDLVLQGHDHSYARGGVDQKEHNHVSGINKHVQTTGTMYVVSVSGGKMYRTEREGWERWGARKNRDAENTQLVQTITVDKDTIQYRSFTATGQLYDAFDLIKNRQGPNILIDRKDEAMGTRHFENTITYFDQLPKKIKKMVLKKYKGYKIDKVSIRPHKTYGTYYDVDIEHKKNHSEIELKISEEGVIFEEEREE